MTERTARPPTIEIPRQLQDASSETTDTGLTVWELGEDGEILITVGHVDKAMFALACDQYARKMWDYSLAGQVEGGLEEIADRIAHCRARIVDPPQHEYHDFELALGEPGDFDLTIWDAR